MQSNIEKVLRENPVIPVIVIDDCDDAVPLANALISGGLDVLEVTLRTSAALEAISEIKKAFPQIKVGTGTVTDMKTLHASLEVGADFMVSPGVTNELIRDAMAEGANLLPGASTPSEVMQLLEQGFACQKFFPAEAAGGVPMLKALAGPLPQVTFCPTGGITYQSASSYLSLPNVACVGGSWMVNSELIKDKRWGVIQDMATQAAGLQSK